MLNKLLLWSGILSSLLYIAINIIVPLQWQEYDIASQTVSELSAIGAPTRSLWLALSIPYTLLVAAFGWGVKKSSNLKMNLSKSGLFLIFYGLVGLAWPFAPMHLREVLASGGKTASDTMHIVLASLTVILMLLSIGFALKEFGSRFHIYSILTMFVLAFFGMLTSLDAPDMEANLPTPNMGVWERICIGAFLAWIIVMAAILLKNYKVKATIDPHGNQPPCNATDQKQLNNCKQLQV